MGNIHARGFRDEFDCEEARSAVRNCMKTIRAQLLPAALDDVVILREETTFDERFVPDSREPAPPRRVASRARPNKTSNGLGRLRH